jgi:hypothetical protein
MPSSLRFHHGIAVVVKVSPIWQKSVFLAENAFWQTFGPLPHELAAYVPKNTVRLCWLSWRLRVPAGVGPTVL